MKRTIGPVTTASAGGAAAAQIIVWLLTLAGLDVPPEVTGAFTVLLTLAGGWLVPSRASDTPGKHTA